MNLFNYIKSRISILDVVQEFCTLKKAGSYWKGSCPFHHEKTGSFTVSPHRQIFYCFGCHKGGDVITFISLLERCTQREAVQFLSERYSIELPESEQQTKHTFSEKKRYELICDSFKQWCHEQLKKSTSIRAYFTQRSIEPATLELFEIGYFPEHSIKLLLEFMRTRSIMLKDLIDAGIIFEGKHGLFSPFEERIIFPIADQIGRTVAFGGRVVKPDDTRPKYYNSQEHEFFTKSSVLYALARAKEPIKQRASVLLVEGYMDVLALHQAGYTNAVATLGTACTQEHIVILSRYTQTIYVMYDGDSAGKQAVLRLTKLVQSLPVELKVVSLPDMHDPASYLQEQSDLQPYITDAQDSLLYMIQSRMTDYYKKPIHERLTVVDEYLELLSHLEDPLKKNMLLQKAAVLFQVPFDLLLGRLARGAKPLLTDPQATSQIELPLLEKKIFSGILKYKSLVSKEDEEFLASQSSKPLQDLLVHMRSFEQAHAPFDLQNFIGACNDQEKQLVSQILTEGNDDETPESLAILIGQLQKKQWKLLVNDVKMELAKNTNMTDSLQAKLSQLQELQKLLMQRGLI